MNDTPPSGPTAAVSGKEDLRIVLFGLPEAGKSSLLGALSQAAQLQEHILGGRLVDESGGLGQLARIVYDGPGQRTADEVVPYPVRYETPDNALDAVLLDCDGRRAGDMLVQKQVPDGSHPSGSLGAEVADADALLLTIDASVTASQMEAEFQEFDQFLRAMEQARGEQTQVAGLPVYLVLTKCDKLAQKHDTMPEWMDRIEQRKMEVDTRFRDFLSRRTDDAGSLIGFGRIDLHVWATAMKRPTLHGTQGRPREPYGVAELFRQTLKDAIRYRQREESSSRKLSLLVGLAAGLIVTLTALIVVMLNINHATATTALAGRVDDMRYLDRETPSERLRGSLEDLRRRQKKLEEFQRDPGYRSLKSDTREWVETRYKEMTDYIAYTEKLLQERSPASERADEGLAEQIARLEQGLKVPDEAWTTTPAGQRHKELLETARAVRKSVGEARIWYEEESQRLADEMLNNREAVNTDWTSWAGRVEKLLSPERRPPFRSSDALPGAAGLTYETVLRFDRVVIARATWEADRTKLRRLLDVTTALGLTPASGDRPAVLSFPRDFTLAQAKERLLALEKAYPDHLKTFARDGLPPAALRRAIRAQYETLLIPARAEVLRQLKAAGSDREETLKRWETVRNWLKEPTELTEWRKLALILLRMEEAFAEDAVDALRTFLNRDSFDLTVESVIVEIPTIRSLAPRAEANLDIYLPSSGKEPALSFRPSGEPRKDDERRVLIYTFRGEGGRLKYRPGDKLWAKLPLRGGNQVMTWAQSRSALYQFERLNRPPLLQEESGAVGTGRELDDVRLVVRPSDGIPAVPDLMPVVKLD